MGGGDAMRKLLGDSYIRSDGTVVDAAIFEKELYKVWNRVEPVLEVITLSFDKTDEQYAKTHSRDIPWLAIHYSEKESRSARKKDILGLGGIPSVGVFNAQTGEAILADAGDQWS
eukprot:gene6503-19597_t